MCSGAWPLWFAGRLDWDSTLFIIVDLKIIESRLVWFGLVSLLNGITTFMGYLMSKISFLKNNIDTISPLAGRKWKFIPSLRVFESEHNNISRV